MIDIQPINKSAANAIVKDWHRHNKPVPIMQISFCYGIWADYNPGGHQLVGVVIVGEPCGRPTGKDRKLILEIRRVCFKPGFNHLKLKRWYPTSDNQPFKDSPTLRNLTMVVKDEQGQTLAYDMTTPYKFPSKIIEYATFFTNRYYENIKVLWTYILKKENGRYLAESGFVQDKIFKRRNTWKRRYTKQLIEERA